MNGQVSNVVRQWDVAQTSFNAADRIVRLVEACSKDNVQPQALRAAESLGFGMLVDPRRISDAVTALGGDESIRILDLRITLGLHNGGVVREMRTSTALIQFFLVATACKLSVINDDIASLMFHMMSTAGILSEIPVSPPQLLDLINIFSGHSETIVPVDLMHEIATLMDESFCDECKTSIHDSFYQMRIESLAKLLLRVFNLLKDDNIQQVVLKGISNGLLIATLFTWLRPDDTELSCAGRAFMGPNTAKLSIVLDGNYDEDEDEYGISLPWSLEVWRQTELQIHELIYESLDTELPTQYPNIPLKCAKSFLKARYPKGNSIDQLGCLVGAIVVFAAKNGHIYHQKACCRKPGLSPCRRARFEDVVGRQWLTRMNTIITEYGWEESYGQQQSDVVENLQRLWSADDVGFRDRLDLAAKLERAVITVLGGLWDESIIWDVIEIAGDALSAAIVTFRSGQRRLRLRARGDFLLSLLSPEGCELSTYMVEAFVTSIGGISSDYPSTLSDLVVHRDGLVAAWSMLWSPNVSQSSALGLSVCVGQLKWDGFPYELLRERYCCLTAEAVPWSVVRFNTRGVENSSLSPLHSESRTLSTQIAASRRRLELRSSFQRVSPIPSLEGIADSSTVWVSWTKSAIAVALSRHIGPLFLGEEEKRRVLEEISNGVVSKISCSSSLSDMGLAPPARRIFRLHSQQLQFFAAGLQDSETAYGRCFTLLIQHSVDPLSYIAKAESFGTGTWAVIGS
ncbi:MAG: hypothetical protein M1825_002873 [Sarcosagium campestre]|nr:MAG: hypothetical protein M1825_002873 [Sarcosagium campestre]